MLLNLGPLQIPAESPIQKELPWGFAGQVGYVATHSTRQLAPIDLNAGQIIGAGAAGKPYEVQWGRDAQTLELRPIGTGHFDSLQAQLQRRFTAGLALTMNYTWGKSINVTDNSSYQLAVNAQKYLDLNRSVTGFRGQRLGVRNVRRPGGSAVGLIVIAACALAVKYNNIAAATGQRPCLDFIVPPDFCCRSDRTAEQRQCAARQHPR